MVIASKLSTPHIVPKAPIVSYSGPSPVLLYFPSLISDNRPQAIGHAKHGFLPVRIVSLIAVPLILSAAGKTPVCQLFVGKPPLIFTKSTIVAVPKTSSVIFNKL
ncbi:hypothetical protein ES703_62987 [subsurface metagenome]